METTEALILAIEMGASDIRTVANDIMATAQEKYPNMLDGHLPRMIEEKLQAADMLLGWAVRARKELERSSKP